MARTKKHYRIAVRTVPNGYTLEFEGMKQAGGYMYHSPLSLVEGIMLHIGLNMKDALDMEKAKAFVEAATNWHDIKKCVAHIAKLEAELDAVKRRRNNLAELLIAERKKYNNFRLDMESISSVAKDECSDLLHQLAANSLLKNKQRRELTMRELTGADCDAITDITTEEDDDDEDAD